MGSSLLKQLCAILGNVAIGGLLVNRTFIVPSITCNYYISLNDAFNFHPTCPLSVPLLPFDDLMQVLAEDGFVFCARLLRDERVLQLLLEVGDIPQVLQQYLVRELCSSSWESDDQRIDAATNTVKSYLEPIRLTKRQFQSLLIQAILQREVSRLDILEGFAEPVIVGYLEGIGAVIISNDRIVLFIIMIRRYMATNTLIHSNISKLLKIVGSSYAHSFGTNWNDLELFNIHYDALLSTLFAWERSRQCHPDRFLSNCSVR